MLGAAMPDPSAATPLVLRPEDPTARKGAILFGVLAVIGVVGVVVEIAAGNAIGIVAAAIFALAGVLLAVVVAIGRAAMRVTVDGDALHIAGRHVPRADITELRRRPVREGGLDVVGAGDAVLYSMPAWFDATQENQLATALGVTIVEPPEIPAEETTPEELSE